MLSMYLSFVFICLFVCFCLYCPVAQKVHHWWVPSLLLRLMLRVETLFISFLFFLLLLLILCVDTCGCRSAEVHLPLHPALMWHLRCLSTLLLCVFVPSSVFYFCFLIYPSSVYRYGKQLGEKRSLLPDCLHDFYDFVLYPGRLPLIDSSYKWIQNHAVNVSKFVCLCLFVQWLRRRITDEDPAFCCVWCLGSKRSYFSSILSSDYFSYCMYIILRHTSALRTSQFSK